VEHASTSSRPEANDNVEHSSTSYRSQTLDDSVEHSSTDNRTRSGDSVDFDSDAPASNTHGDQGERSPRTRQQPLDRSNETTPEGSLTVTVGALADGLYVADDGTGIPVDERETGFELGHSSMNGGTRLGLAIVEQIIAAHDWNVPLTTADCGGARVEIRF
jgi:fructose/tagatose bisphosphate aldolase